MAVMLYPDDIEKQQEWVEQAAHWSFISRKKKGLGPMPSDLTDDMGIEYWSRATGFQTDVVVTRQASSSAKKGIIAGDVLRHIYLMNKAGVAEPSIRKARFIVSNKAHRYKDSEQSKRYSERDINIAWSSRKKVSHLWAALRLNQQYPYVDNPFESPEALKVFLIVARTFQGFATTFIPLRRREPLIALNSLYRIPEDFSLSDNFNPPAFIDGKAKKYYEKKLKKYSAPTR